MSDEDIGEASRTTTTNRRELLRGSVGSLLAVSGVGVSAARRTKDSPTRSAAELIEAFEASEDKAEFYRTLSDQERKSVREGLRPERIGTATSEVSENPFVSAQGNTTTYTKRQRIPVENEYGQEIIHYNHRLDWVVDTDAEEVQSISVDTSGSGSLFWEYSHDIDPQQRTVHDDGCHSTRSGLFQYCNSIDVEGYGFSYCTAELNTRITSAISGFPNGNSTTAQNIDGECGRDCY